MFKSIRWNLLSWYAIILFAVLLAFGGMLFERMEHLLRQGVEKELRAYALAIAGATEDENGKLKVELSEEYLRHFSSGEKGAPYFVVWDREGKIVLKSDNATQRESLPAGHRSSTGPRRQLAIAGPSGTVVFVGREVRREQEKQRELLGSLFAVGGGVMVLALVGGWFLAGRALAPVRRMSEAAAAVTASNLAQRIDVGKTESELGQLAGTLNGAFDRLEKAFERQTRFTADASHELRTPLAIVMSQAEMALRKDRTPEEYREALETSLKASQRMKAVVEGLLTLARADAKELDLRKERVDLGRVVEETASLLGPLALERKVALTVSAEPVAVTGDSDRLREVVTNLITNAVRYNVQGGKVDVTLAVQKDQAALSIVDTGIGIPEKDQAQLFERFFRVDKARSREVGGSGLGLAISKWIIEAHGGTISFASRENAGSTFTVRLPRAL
jgi:two-component system OmpR family sensor kinase